MTRLQQRLLARYESAQLLSGIKPIAVNLLAMQEARAAYLGDAIVRYRPRLTPIALAVQKHGIYATGCQLRKAGVHFVDAFVSIFGRMPRHV